MQKQADTWRKFPGGANLLVPLLLGVKNLSLLCKSPCQNSVGEWGRQNQNHTKSFSFGSAVSPSVLSVVRASIQKAPFHASYSSIPKEKIENLPASKLSIQGNATINYIFASK